MNCLPKATAMTLTGFCLCLFKCQSLGTGQLLIPLWPVLGPVRLFFWGVVVRHQTQLATKRCHFYIFDMFLCFCFDFCFSIFKHIVKLNLELSLLLKPNWGNGNNSILTLDNYPQDESHCSDSESFLSDIFPLWIISTSKNHVRGIIAHTILCLLARSWLSPMIMNDPF